MLEQLGPDYRFRTVVAARGPVAEQTVSGDLAIIGRGDPTASDHMKGDAMLPLREIADSLWQRGIRRITGNVVAAGNAISRTGRRIWMVVGWRSTAHRSRASMSCCSMKG